LRPNTFLLITGIVISLLALASSGCSHSGARTSGGIKDDFKPDLNDPKLKEKLGADDGYSFAIMYGSDIHGSLETCG
jgi:hypothetical protein